MLISVATPPPNWENRLVIKQKVNSMHCSTTQIILGANQIICNTLRGGRGFRQCNPIRVAIWPYNGQISQIWPFCNCLPEI